MKSQSDILSDFDDDASGALTIALKDENKALRADLEACRELVRACEKAIDNAQETEQESPGGYNSWTEYTLDEVDFNRTKQALDKLPDKLKERGE